MQIKFRYQKKYLSLFLIFLFSIFLFGLVVSLSSSSHVGENIEITIGAVTGNLQDLIDEGHFNGSAGEDGTNLQGDSCRFCRTCGGAWPKEVGRIGHFTYAYADGCVSESGGNCASGKCVRHTSRFCCR